MKKTSAFLIIFIAGLVSSALCIVLMYLLMVKFDFFVPGMYILIVPVGAILAGIFAGSGYAIASKFTNTRVSKAAVLLILLFSLVVYLAAYYVMYAFSFGDYSISNFFKFLGNLATNSSLTIGKSARTKIDTVGIFGIALLTLEFIGFAIGAATPLYYLTGKEYCHKCGLYLKPLNSYYHMPTLEKWNPSPGDDKAAIARMIEENRRILKEQYEKTKVKLEGKSLAENEKTLQELDQSQDHRSFFYFSYAISGCPNCGKHSITITLHSMGQQQYTTTTEVLGVIEN
ncbi:MAG: hypothetical protein APR63_05395 [Desulfuromonas sp. SDB]|nr:MAG: hypothetical protein APR63_05395 [Desulfuromonas sp. SDB]